MGAGIEWYDLLSICFSGNFSSDFNAEKYGQILHPGIIFMLNCVIIHSSMPEPVVISIFGILFGLFFHKIPNKLNLLKSKSIQRKERVIQMTVGIAIAIFPWIVLCY
jgi:hypothetical protein